MADIPTFAEAGMTAAEPPAARGLYHITADVRFDDGEQLQVEYMCEAESILDGLGKVIRDLKSAHASDGGWEIIQLNVRKLPAVMK